MYLYDGFVADLRVWVAMLSEDLHSCHHGSNVDSCSEGIERDVLLHPLCPNFLAHFLQDSATILQRLLQPLRLPSSFT